MPLGLKLKPERLEPVKSIASCSLQWIETRSTESQTFKSYSRIECIHLWCRFIAV